MDPRWQVLYRQLIESTRGPAARARHSSVKEPFSPGRAAEGGRPSLAPEAKEETRLPNGARRSGRRFANLARWVWAVFAKKVGGHLVGGYLVLSKTFVYEGFHKRLQVEGKET